MRLSHSEVLPSTSIHKWLKRVENERDGYMIQRFGKGRNIMQLLRSANKLKAEAALEGTKHKDTCLIKEVKKLSCPLIKASLPDVVDGCSGEEVIVGKLKEVYMEIYNRNEAEDEVLKFTDKIERLTTHKDGDLVNLINAKVVKQATKLMKNNKADISGGFK